MTDNRAPNAERPNFFEIAPDSELAAKVAKRSACALRAAIREAYADVPA